MRVQPQNLSKVLTKYLNEYKEDIDEEVISSSNSVAKQAKDELTRTSPPKKGSLSNRGRHYKDGWTISTQNQKSQNWYTKKIWNKTDYQLTHLLEFGHHIRNGGWVAAQPHIRPVEQKYIQKFVQELEREIRQ